MSDLSATFDKIEQAIADIRKETIADDTPVTNRDVSLVINRDLFGDWTLTTMTGHGTTSANFGPRPGDMLTALFDFLYEVKAGNWEAFPRETPR